MLTTYIEILCFINLFLLIGDGRMDRPGFNANFCTCVLINNDSLDILDMVVVDKKKSGVEKYQYGKKRFDSWTKTDT